MENEYKPTEVSPPCEAVRELLEKRGISKETFGQSMGWAPQKVEEFFDGDVPLERESIDNLVQLFGVPAEFWWERHRLYRNDLVQRFNAGSAPRNDQGTAMRPQYASVYVYEDRWGNHCVRVEMNEQYRCEKLPVSPRRSLSDSQTLATIGRLIQELEVLE